MKNSGAPSFSLPSLKRFNELKPDGKPGPGAYDLKIGISDSASQFISTFKSPKTRTYYHSDRKTIDIPKDAICNLAFQLIYFIRTSWTRQLQNTK